MDMATGNIKPQVFRRTACIRAYTKTPRYLFIYFSIPHFKRAQALALR